MLEAEQWQTIPLPPTFDIRTMKEFAFMKSLAQDSEEESMWKLPFNARRQLFSKQCVLNSISYVGFFIGIERAKKKITEQLSSGKNPFDSTEDDEDSENVCFLH